MQAAGSRVSRATHQHAATRHAEVTRKRSGEPHRKSRGTSGLRYSRSIKIEVPGSGTRPRLCQHYAAGSFLVSNLYPSAVTLIGHALRIMSLGGGRDGAREG
jgi:hypothetical protein